jgi:hypothetical protein
MLTHAGLDGLDLNQVTRFQWRGFLSDEEQERAMLRIRTAILPIVCALFWLNVSVAQAGPCSADIAQFEQAIRNSAGNPFAGLSAPQSVTAQMDRQPTPASIKKEQASLKAKFSALMARAKRLDALSQAKRMYIL